MKKSELRQMIREEVRTEVLRSLPILINEAMDKVIGEALAKPVRKKRPMKKRVVESTATKKAPMDRTKLAALIGYGDMEGIGGRHVETPPTVQPEPAPTPQPTIAGVPVTGGLAAHEAAAGQGHFRDYTMEEKDVTIHEGMEAAPMHPDMMPDGAPIQHSVMETPLPAHLVSAIERSGDIFKAAEKKSNWRPGMKR